jgi:hypothetical protein
MQSSTFVQTGNIAIHAAILSLHRAGLIPFNFYKSLNAHGYLFQPNNPKG